MTPESLDRLKTKCPACGHLNYPHRTSCDKCGAGLLKAFPTYQEPLERAEIPCPSCGHMNDRRAVACGYCAVELRQPLDALPVSGPKRRPRRGISPAVLWGIYGAVAIVAGFIWGIGKISSAQEIGPACYIGGIFATVVSLRLAGRLCDMGNKIPFAIILASLFFGIEAALALAFGDTSGVVVLILNGILVVWFALARKHLAPGG